MGTRKIYNDAGDLVNLLPEKGVVCRYCKQDNLLRPDPGACYCNAIDENGNKHPWLCLCREARQYD